MNGGGSAILSPGSTDTMLIAPLYFRTQLAQTAWPSLLRSYHANESATTFTSNAIAHTVNVQSAEFFSHRIHLFFSALTLLVGRQEGHPACKNIVVGCWCGCLAGARCRLAYGSADDTATQLSLASVKSRLVLPFTSSPG